MELAQQVRIASTKSHVLGGDVSIVLGYLAFALLLVAIYLASGQPGTEPGDFSKMTLFPYA